MHRLYCPSQNISDNKINVFDKVLAINDSVSAEGIDFKLTNITDNTAYLFGNIFTGPDIKSVCIVDQQGVCSSRVLQTTGGYEFMFQIFVSADSADRFAEMTKDMEVSVNPQSGEEQLSDLTIYIGSFFLNITQLIRLVTLPVIILIIWSWAYFLKSKSKLVALPL